ncbi:MAG TPA: sigma-54 dependent transcriptional regulator [Gemmatimonadaceae bacterium]|nr:sigma-54 dependent transcriptional regulator [Gemmatimonadaceae bacterium]
MTTVLVCDDNLALAEQYAYDLKRLAQHEVLIAGSGNDALDILSRETVDCVILDLEMPRMDGFGVLRAMRERNIDVPVIVYTGTGSYDRCVQAVKLGAYGFVSKDDPVERLAQEIENAVERRQMIAEVMALRRYAADESALRGSSPAIARLKDAITRVAPIPSPVLIIGESGSGKELVARDVHRLSAGAREPFIAVNSAALPEQLVESELFGHERGAYTGAATARKGAFEEAGRGTLFLDEIGELPLAAQAKLLRVLEERAVVRLGSNRPIQVPARVVAATNRDLEAESKEGRFRRDLFYRLNVHVLHVPPLRDRLSDLPELVDHLLAHIADRFRMRRKRLAPDVLAILMGYDWRQNNVRELRNIVERMVIAADGDIIGAEHIPPEIRDASLPTSPTARTFVERKAEAERRIVVEALDRNDWHITRTAADLGLADHASLLKIMRRHGISRD